MKQGTLLHAGLDRRKLGQSLNLDSCSFLFEQK